VKQATKKLAQKKQKSVQSAKSADVYDISDDNEPEPTTPVATAFAAYVDDGFEATACNIIWNYATSSAVFNHIGKRPHVSNNLFLAIRTSRSSLPWKFDTGISDHMS
jgi:hypothetical protein